jgi:ubiquinone/menaquinone biosynthesis C-methylase UbiE
VAVQDDSGFKSLLSMSWVYELFQNLVGAGRMRRWLSQNFWRLQSGQKVVDVGCGPAVIRKHLPPDIQYVGFDISEKYIATACRKYGDQGTFLVGTAEDFIQKPDERMRDADLVICTGLLHHLNDEETLQILTLAKMILRPGGRLVCLEPTFLIHQGSFSRWIMRRDRGRNVRTETEWKAIVARVFPTLSSNIIVGMLRIPYIHIVIECRKELHETRDARPE